MNSPFDPPAARQGRRLPALVIGVLAIAGLGLAILDLAAVLSPARWLAAFDADPVMDALVFRDAALPRMAAALLAGALLGAAGAVFQQVLRNPLASPDTLGASSGGDLALALAVLFRPDLLAFDRTLVSLAGALGVGALVLALAMRSRCAVGPTLLIGLSLTLCLNAATAVLVLLRSHDLSGLLVWMGGSLAVQSWQPVCRLALLGTPVLALLALLIRPLNLFDMTDDTARALGGSVALLRFGCLALAVGSAAIVSGGFGTIGFVSLLAPTLTRLAGVRRFGPMFGMSLVMGALLLWVTDGCAAALSSRLGTDLPTGALTTLIGMPVLVGLSMRQRRIATADAPATALARTRSAAPVVGVLLLAIGVLLPLTLLGGRGATGWTMTWPGPALEALLPWRLPRTAGAAAAGALLGMSGAVLQRVSRNPLASPEMLGLGAGAGAGLLIALLMGGGPLVRSIASIAGALTTAACLLGWTIRSRGEAGQFLVFGLALTALVGAIIGVMTAIGDPRGMQAMAWMAGSTYRTGPWAAGAACLLCGPALVLLALSSRWLDLMPLGPGLRVAVGLSDASAQAWLLMFAAGLAACGTLIIGPLSFVGLVAPHLVAACGVRRAWAQGLCTALGGAALMIVADAVGRTVAFPWQVPTGLVATLLASPVLIALLMRRAPL